MFLKIQDRVRFLKIRNQFYSMNEQRKNKREKYVPFLKI